MTLHRDRNKTGENEAGVPAKVSLFASYVLGGVLLLVPFHALLTVFASTIVGNYDLLRLWKEILMLALVPFAVFVVWKTPDLQRRLREGWLFWAMASYAALHICLGLIALAKGQVNTYALLYAWVVNLRPLLIFTLAFVFAWPVGLARPLGRDLTMGRSAGQLAWLYRYWKQILLVPAALVIGFGMLQATVLPYDFLRGFGYSMATIEPYQTVDDKLGYIRIQSTLRGANPLGAYLVVVLSALVVLIGLLSKRFLSKHDSDVTSQHSRGDKALSANKLPKELPILARAWAASKTGHTIAIVLLTLAGAGVLAAT